MRRPGLSTVVFDGYPMEQACNEVARLGFADIEIAFIRGYVSFEESAFGEGPAREMRARLAAAGLNALAVSAHIDLGEPGAASALTRRLRYAAGIGARILVTNTTTADRVDACLAAIAANVDLAMELDIQIALENPGHGNDDLIGTGRQGAAFVARIGAPSVRLNYDFGNIYTYNRGNIDVVGDFLACSEYVAYAHVKDIGERGRDWRFTAIGDGSVGETARHCLSRAGQQIPTAFELPLRLSRPNRADPVRDRPPLALSEIRRQVLRSTSFWASAVDF